MKRIITMSWHASVRAEQRGISWAEIERATSKGIRRTDAGSRQFTYQLGSLLVSTKTQDSTTEIVLSAYRSR